MLVVGIHHPVLQEHGGLTSAGFRVFPGFGFHFSAYFVQLFYCTQPEVVLVDGLYLVLFVVLRRILERWLGLDGVEWEGIEDKWAFEWCFIMN